MNKNDVKAMYIHIPFCKKICSYCDFCKMYYNQEFVSKYLEKLKEEVNSKYQNEKLKTIYIGGGTPSSLNYSELEKLFSITNNLNLEEEYEFTIEANIQDINEEFLKICRKNKVNRLSIGIETINPKFYDFLNRSNDKEEVIKRIELAKKFFHNINIDLMYGFSNQTIEDLLLDLEFFKSLDIPHISIYSLILEEHTKLFVENTKSLDEELESKMYYIIIDYLEKLGYNHYEVSNFAKSGYESKHNLTYWNNERYYGFGLGASGYLENIRYTNTRSLNKYLNDEFILYEDKISRNIAIENEMILGLRKIRGVNKEEFISKYQVPIERVFDIIKLKEEGMILDKDGYIKIPKDKLYISNQILINFMGGNNE